MLFSVIIPTYNRETLIETTLESVFAQEFKDFEVLVVDDGSTDGTFQKLSAYAERIRVMRQVNKGPGAARNLGAKHARGDYLAFLDSDDLWFPWTLKSYSEAISQTNHAFITGKPFRFHNENELRSVNVCKLTSNLFSDYLSSGDEWRWWGVSSFLVRRSAFAAAGGFSNDWINGEDADLALRLGVARGFTQVTAPFTFAYREHEASAMKNLSRTLAGTIYKIRAEQAGRYPGGVERAHQRWRILTRHVRPITLECLRRGMRSEALELYRATLRWHLALNRWKYLCGFPLQALLARG